MVPEGVPAFLKAKRVSGTEVCVLLELMRYQCPDGTFSRPRRDVAEALGMTENAVSMCVFSMLRKGAVAHVSKGHRGKTSVYRLALDE